MYHYFAISFFLRIFASKMSLEVSQKVPKSHQTSPKNSPKSNTTTPKMQHLTLIFDQFCLFFAQKIPKNSLPFFELGESVSKSTPLVFQKHPLSVSNSVLRCSKMASLCVKKHLIFAPSVFNKYVKYS